LNGPFYAYIILNNMMFFDLLNLLHIREVGLPKMISWLSSNLFKKMNVEIITRNLELNVHGYSAIVVN